MRNTRRCIRVCLLGCLAASAAGVAQAPEAGETVGVQARARKFVSLLAKEDFTAAAKNFDAKMKQAMGPARLKAAWRSLTKLVGAFQRQGAVRTEKLRPYEAVFVRCQFAAGSMDVKVVFDKAGQIAGLFFLPATSAKYTPPGYVKRESFREEDVAVGSGEWALPGTLSLPRGRGPFPAVVLVHGSGPHDRDETVGATKPFRDLAWGLASRGVAVLRYEKRTKAHGAKLPSILDRLTVKEETIDDALAGVALLRKTKGIDAGKVVVLGHSLGGMLVPRIARRDPAIAGFVVLAAPARPLVDLMVQQMAYIYSLDGKLDEEEESRLGRLKAEVARIEALKPSATEPRVLLGAPAGYWLDLRGYRPAEEARKIPRPMLVLQGRRDYQVTAADFDLWKEALSSRKDVTFKLYPQLNHLFVAGEGKSTPAEYQKPGHVAKEVVEDVAGWVKRLSRPGA